MGFYYYYYRREVWSVERELIRLELYVFCNLKFKPDGDV